MNPLVSICIPTYKQKEYLQRCLVSVLEQDFKNFELIISDDTQDDSLEIFIKSILKDFPYSYLRNIPAKGMPENWNSAIQQATGKYIKILHHDDFFTQSDSLKLMVEEIENKKGDFLFCQTDVWHIKTGIHHFHKISHKQLNLLNGKPEFLFFKNMIGSPSVTLYLNDLSLKYDSRFKWLVDIDFYMQILFQKKQIVYLNKPLITTIHGSDEQVTGYVLNDKVFQIKEHVHLFNKIKSQISNINGFSSFFDYLFSKYEISTYAELLKITNEADENKLFFETIIINIPKNRKWKWFKKRFFESRYNNYIFKFEQFV